MKDTRKLYKVDNFNSFTGIITPYRKVFHCDNKNYPFKTSSKEYKNKINNKNNNTMNIKNLSDKIVHTLKLPCKRYHGTNLINSIKASTKKSFPEFHDVRILTGTKLSSQFNIKDNTNEQRKNA